MNPNKKYSPYIFARVLKPLDLNDLTLVLMLIGGVLGWLFNDYGLRPLDVSSMIYLRSSFVEGDIGLEWLRHSWSLIHQLGYFGMLIGLDHATLSLIISMLTAMAMVMGIGFLLYGLSGSTLFAILMAPVFSLGNFLPFMYTNYYPQMIGSVHLSWMGMSMALLTIGLAGVGRVRLSGLCAGIAMATHILFGLWAASLLCLYFITVFLKGDRACVKPALQGLTGGILFVMVCYAFQNLAFNPVHLHGTYPDLFATYLSKWDHHRALETNYKAIVGSFAITASVLIYHRVLRLQSFKTFSAISVMCIGSIVVSTLVYGIGEFGTGSLRDMLNSVISGRFMALNAFLASLLIAAALYAWFSGDRKLHPVWLQLLVLAGLFFVLNRNGLYLRLLSMEGEFVYFVYIAGAMGLVLARLIYVLAPKCIYLSRSMISVCAMFALVGFAVVFGLRGITAHDCSDIKVLRPVLVDDFRTYKIIQRDCNLPVLVDPSSFDVIPYIPWAVQNLSDILTYGYGVNFSSPPQGMLSTGSVEKKYFVETWKARNLKDWIEVKNKLNINVIATRPDLPLQLPIIYKHKLFILYEIGAPL